MDTSGWYDNDDYPGYGDLTRVATGTGGVTSASGSWHGLFMGGDSAPFTRFGGYSAVWPGTWSASIDIYLDTSWAAGAGFDYSVAANGSDNAHQRDYIFHVASDTSTGDLIVGASNNTNFGTREDLDTLANHYVVSDTGWYTFEHVFYEDGGVLAVDLNLYTAGGAQVFSETRTNAADVLSEIGGNRYGWFTFIDVNGGIHGDDVQLLVGKPAPEPTTLATLGMAVAALAAAGLRRRRTRAKR